MNQAQQQLTQLAEGFVKALVRLVAEASIEELVRLAGATRPSKSPPPTSEPPTPRRRGRPRKTHAPELVESSRGRRGSAQLARLQERVIEQVGRLAGEEGTTSSKVASALRLPVEKVMRPLTKALKAGLIRKTGERQFTRYFPAS